jgi:hypothetical protein
MDIIEFMVLSKSLSTIFLFGPVRRKDGSSFSGGCPAAFKRSSSHNYLFSKPVSYLSIRNLAHSSKNGISSISEGRICWISTSSFRYTWSSSLWTRPYIVYYIIFRLFTYITHELYFFLLLFLQFFFFTCS